MSKSELSTEGQNKLSSFSELITTIFRNHYHKGITEFEFALDELIQVAKTAKIKLPKALNEIISDFRFKTAMPDEIAKTAPKGFKWVIKVGRENYSMKLRRVNRFTPSNSWHQIKIPDVTPTLVADSALTVKQAVLAKVRYNRLIDIFLGVTAYSLQNHLRTTVPEIGQIETDEIYVGVRNTGQQFVIPVQAKGGKDKIGAVQVEQDLALCRHKYSLLTPRPVAVQSMTTDKGEVIVMFELVEDNDEIKVLDEKQYRLVPSSEITPDDLKTMARGSF
jgi:hypothetical protein